MPLSSSETREYLAICRTIALEAGALILRHYESNRTARAKADHSPVTDADMESNQLIVTALGKAFGHIPVVSEEDADSATHLHADYFWLVDPLDGTRSFVEGTGEFTVNIGLVQGDSPVLGVLLAPVQDMLYFGGIGVGAYLQQGDGNAVSIHTRVPPSDGISVVRSQSHPSAKTNEYLSKFNIANIVNASSALKFGLLAEGKADLYPRFGTTMEWDTAAGHAIIDAAGGCVLDIHGEALRYGKQGYTNGAFVAFGNPSLVPQA